MDTLSLLGGGAQRSGEEEGEGGGMEDGGGEKGRDNVAGEEGAEEERGHVAAAWRAGMEGEREGEMEGKRRPRKRETRVMEGSHRMVCLVDNTCEFSLHCPRNICFSCI